MELAQVIAQSCPLDSCLENRTMYGSHDSHNYRKYKEDYQ
jgi:hypothetical protein